MSEQNEAVVEKPEKTKIEITVANLARFLAEHFPNEMLAGVSSGETVDAIVIRLLQNSPAAKRNAAVLDPNWVPIHPSELPELQAVLDSTLMEMQNRSTLSELRNEVLGLYKAKAAVYTGASGIESCFARGMSGLLHNLARKWDRIEAVMTMMGMSGSDEAAAEEARAEGFGEPETIYVTARDLAIYCMHLMRYVAGQKAKAVKTGE